MTAKTKTKRAAQADTAAPVSTVVAEKPTPVIANEAPPAGTNAVVVVGPVQLPDTATDKIRKEGDLIAVDELKPDQIDAAKKIVKGFDLNKTMSILTFAAEPQRQMSAFLDELTAMISVREAGIAGDMAKQMAYGIDIMALAKVKEQIVNGTTKAGKLLQAVHMATDYIKNFYANRLAISDLIAKLESKGNNRMATIQGKVEQLDKLIDKTEKQIYDLAPYILAGEMIVLQAQDQYAARRDVVMKSKSVVEATKLRDMRDRIIQLEVRLLKAKYAFVRAGTEAIPEVRNVQKADTIEVQNISEEILFDMPEFKRLIVVIANLNDLKAVRDDRKLMDDNRRKLDEIAADATQDATKFAIESQGNILADVERLETIANKIAAGIKIDEELEKASAEKRNLAHQKLVAIKDVVTDAIKEAAAR